MLYKDIISYKWYSLDVLRDNDEIWFVCWESAYCVYGCNMLSVFLRNE